MTSPSRRQFNQLALAAFSGTLAGSILGCNRGQPEKTAGTKTSGTSEHVGEHRRRQDIRRESAAGRRSARLPRPQSMQEPGQDQDERVRRARRLRHGGKTWLRRPERMQGARRLRRASRPESVQRARRLCRDAQGQNLAESSRQVRGTHDCQKPEVRACSREGLIVMPAAHRDLAHIQGWMQSVIMNPSGVVGRHRGRRRTRAHRRFAGGDRNGHRALVAPDQHRAAPNLFAGLLRSTLGVPSG